MTPTECQSNCSECGEPLSELWRNAGGCPYCGTPVDGAIDRRSFMLGTTGYGFSGRGWIVVPLGIALPVLAMYLCIVYLYDCFVLPSAFLIPSGSSWVATGITCWILGRIWNRDQALHRFLGFRVDSWGLFYFVPGVLMLLPLLLPVLVRAGFDTPELLGQVAVFAAVACFILQVVLSAVGLALLLVWMPIYVVKLIGSFKTQSTQTRIHHEHC
jgi:hypothetical protein